MDLDQIPWFSRSIGYWSAGTDRLSITFWALRRKGRDSKEADFGLPKYAHTV